jgi:hypothetical protein
LVGFIFHKFVTNFTHICEFFLKIPICKMGKNVFGRIGAWPDTSVQKWRKKKPVSFKAVHSRAARWYICIWIPKIIPVLVIFELALEWKIYVWIHRYLMVILCVLWIFGVCILWSLDIYFLVFGILQQEKSVNPGS